MEETNSTELIRQLETTGETSSIEWTLQIPPDTEGPDKIWSPEFGGLLRWQLYWDKTLPLKVNFKLYTPVQNIRGTRYINFNSVTHSYQFLGSDESSKLMLYPFWATSPNCLRENDRHVVIKCTIIATPKQLLDTSPLFTSLNAQRFADTVIRAKGADLHAYSGVLSSRNSVLRKLFADAACKEVPGANHVTDKQEFVVTLKDNNVFEVTTSRNQSAVEALLCVLYTGSCSLEMFAKGGVDLLALSCFCVLRHLKYWCEYVFSTSLASKNAIQLLLVAEEYSAKFLKSHAIRHIMRIPKMPVITKKYWRDLEPNHGELARNLSLAYSTQDPIYGNFSSPKRDPVSVSDTYKKLNQREFHNCEIVVNTRTFTCHRAVLASRCPVFGAMLFTHDCREKLERKIEMTDISENVFEVFLRYMYTGVCFAVTKPGLCDEWLDLLISADKYDLSELHQLCETELMKLVTEETALDLLPLADSHNAAKLRSAVVEFIAKNIFKFLETSKWKKFVSQHSIFATEVLTKFALSTKST